MGSPDAYLEEPPLGRERPRERGKDGQLPRRLKASYWRWPDRDLAGNAIDFYVKVLGTSFNDAMKELTKG